jgi:hypothetical protein
MHRTVRTVHLCTALMVLPFLLLYLASAVQLAHRSWFPLSQSTSRRTIALPAGLDDARVVARSLWERRAVRGELAGIQTATDSLQFRMVHPGEVSRVEYSAATGVAMVETTRAGFMGFANRLHQLHGAWHDEAALNVWAAALGLLSLAMLTMGATGLFLWFQDRSLRRTGGILLVAGVVFALSLIISMRG